VNGPARGSGTQGVADRLVPLPEILARLPGAHIRGDAGTVTVTSVTFDSREVRAGALHCCLPGDHADGREFAAAARRAGAVALLSEGPLETGAAGGAVEIEVAPGGGRAAMALAACAFEGDPATSLRMIGVTGTNGKTTVTHLVRSVLEANGWPTAVIGTLGGVRTTPESPHLQRALRTAVDHGRTAVAMEVTSHALVQRRVDGICFDVAAFTNLTQDHLDFHGTMEDYFEAKASLFTPGRAALGVINADDPYGARLLARAPIPLVEFSLARARVLDVGATASRFLLAGREVSLRLGGTFNVANALCAAAIAEALGVPADAVVGGLEAVGPLPGRFEPVRNDLGFAVLVDYAHTPAGLEEVLGAARAALKGQGGSRLIVVFGCGGDRDRAKRPVMGHIATRAADVAVLTSDNPRSEDPLQIIGEVRAGCDGPAELRVEPDRDAAIGLAISLAGEGDVVVVAGKGHETSQEFADRVVHFDDREVAAGYLEERRGR
jgi:UDP-N-acetylmuramoyl-L-alanyl-D-glutamate--2,6-diaminopimelate ligase